MNRKRSVILSLLMTVVSVAGTLAATALPANAGGYYEKTATVVSSSPPNDAWCVRIQRDGTLGRACFAHYGDYFWLKDMKADGAGVYVWGETSNPSETFVCYNNGGADAGWQRCGFSGEMNENNQLIFAGYARMNGNDKYGKSDFQGCGTSG